MTKADWRERQRNLSFAEKIAILEKMRNRDAAVARAGLRGKSELRGENATVPESRDKH
jgi:hypothetical protein